MERHQELSWNTNTEPLSQAPSKTVTSDSGLGCAKMKTIWLCFPERHCFCPKTPALLRVGGS